MKNRILICVGIIIVIIVTIIICRKRGDRTNEEYISIFLSNRSDFECVAQVLQKWTTGSVNFNNGISSGNQEIEKEILNNDIFRESLSRLYELKEIDIILIEGNEIAFYFYKFPKNYHGGIFYGINLESNICTYFIDDYWALKVIPNM